ncbi:MAG TPA: hypothetical protein VFA20_25770 [Myxococcaceae bacterium]|nr:hypothetical protein [Myxococcaceae bacterium]
MKKLVVVGAAGACIGFAVACGIGAQKACEDSAAAQCQQLDQCWSGYGVSRTYPDLGTCQSRLAAQCEAALVAPSTGATPDTVESCASSLPTETCSDLFDNTPPEVCQTRVGKLANGAPCAFPAQCASAFCAVDANAVCGTCQDLPSVGDSCEDNGCGPGKQCVTDYTGARVCAQPVGGGQGCTRVSPCKADLTCVGDTTDGLGGGVPGICQPNVTTAGDPCDSARRLAPLCNQHDNLYCTPRTNLRDGGAILGECVPGVYVTPGEACERAERDGGSPLLCSAGSQCVAVDAGLSLCVATAAEGQPCDTAVGPPCESPARCVISPADLDAGATSGLCTLRDATACH